MDVLWLLLIVLFLATLNETLIEFLFGEILAKFAPKVSWVLKYIAVVSAVVMVFIYRLDIVYLLAKFTETEWQPLAEPSTLGIIITGIAVGKGSSYLHDLFKKYFVKPSTPSELPK